MTAAQELKKLPKMAQLVTTAAHICHRLQEMYPQKFAHLKHQSQESSPFRRWTTGSGAGSSYRHADHRTLYSKQVSEGSTQGKSSSTRCVRGKWANGGVARWSLGLEQLLADPLGRAAFHDFLAREYAQENLTFWTKCEEYKRQEDPELRAEIARTIWETHLAETAPEPINIDATARRAASSQLSEESLPIDLFSQAQREIFNVLRMDPYPRFLRSGAHDDCARAELCGLPPPPAGFEDEPEETARAGPSASPAPPITPPSDFGSNGPASASLKIKKSASNVSDRRRSGGSSILPWRLRGLSRSRDGELGASSATPPPRLAAARPIPAQSDPARPKPLAKLDAADQDPSRRLSDVVKSGPLCRVVLPDGATSVVGVDPTMSVRRLVDRLLQRRNLLTQHYDVLYRDTADNAHHAAIDAGAPSSVLGGREVVVERRCVVRVQLGDRVVAVRCRPARRLRHVLRPVLARYSHAAVAHVLRDGAHVALDTAMLDLDGCRLEVVELPRDVLEGTRTRRCPESDAEEDEPRGSACEVAFSDHSSQAPAELPEQVQRDSTVPGLADDAAPLPADLIQPAPQGRVRAALMPGPPIHHHEPCLLDNLRSIQHQRAQTLRMEPASQARAESRPGPSTAPTSRDPTNATWILNPKRTPPPLPPKPPREPTLV